MFNMKRVRDYIDVRLDRLFTPEDVVTIRNNATGVYQNLGEIVKANGAYRLIDEFGEVLGEYSRRRDAVRGATRKGIALRTVQFDDKLANA